MSRSKSPTRKKPRSYPRGVLDVRYGGYGFVKTAEGEYFIPERKMGYAFTGDLVEVSPLPKRGKYANAPAAGCPAARVVRVLGRAHDSLIGRYEVCEPFGIVVPEDPRINHDIFTMRADNPDVPDGSLVRVRIVTFPERNAAATGVIEEVLGPADESAVDIELIIAHHGLETEFSEAARKEASLVTLDEEGALRDGYRDLRDRFTMTIDPADARDFDDALSIEKTDNGWRLGVHIADVAHYVPWNSSLDLDARRRATSVYLADRVIPMLPEELSAEMCSLKPGCVRRTMTVDLYVDKKAHLVSYDIYPALICSHARLTYEQALDLLTDSKDEIGGRLRALSTLAKARAAARKARGGLDFATVEAKARLDDEGHTIGIDVRRKTDATSLVEEAMIFANEVVAHHISEREFPCIYRVHEQPAADALSGLIPVFQEFSWFSEIPEALFVAGNPHALCDVLDRASGRPEEELVSSLLVRAMQRAVYRPDCAGHYGLASTHYAHFTSPIRRYPDLMVHRALHALYAGEMADRYKPAKDLTWLSEHSSVMERVADSAARESQECKIIEYLQQSVSMRFSGIISGVATYGIYVRLENTAEGLVPIRFLGSEYFALDPARHLLTGQETGKVWRLGDRVEVRLEEAQPRTRTLVFSVD
ncbi:MAG: ribonuclease R [Eggerthellaceae bacterium]|nr:ribonuclease R [Eggerthellaceae bacterium]